MFDLYSGSVINIESRMYRATSKLKDVSPVVGADFSILNVGEGGAVSSLSGINNSTFAPEISDNAPFFTTVTIYGLLVLLLSIFWY